MVDLSNASPRTRSLIDTMREKIPGFDIRFKDDAPGTIPWYHRFLHFMGRLVNPSYNERYTTVLYPAIYFPVDRKAKFEANPDAFYTTLRHEYVHLVDIKRLHILYALTYVAVLPAFFTMRGYWELRGYTQNMIAEFEKTGSISDAQIERLTDIFTSRDYVFMFPRKYARRKLLELREDIESGRVKGAYPYQSGWEPPRVG